MPENFPAEPRPLSQRLLASFQEFIQVHPPHRVSRHLRCILLDYIRIRLDVGLPIDFDSCLEEFYDLFELLDQAMEEGIGNKE